MLGDSLHAIELELANLVQRVTRAEQIADELGDSIHRETDDQGGKALEEARQQVARACCARDPYQTDQWNKRRSGRVEQPPSMRHLTRSGAGKKPPVEKLRGDP